MNISLKKRIGISFALVNLMALIIGFTVFYFFNSLNDQVDQISNSSTIIGDLSDEISISAVTILKKQKKVLTYRASAEDIEELKNECDNFHSQLERLNTFYTETEIKSTISKMIGYVDALKTLLSKTSLSNYRDRGNVAAIGELADKILESFLDFQDIQYHQNLEKDKQLKSVIGETRRYMLWALIITFLTTIVISLVIPAKISLPFKKINDAVRELQDCNFDVSIYYNQDDEIGELAKELNKMIRNMKIFEELREDRISVEHRKFDILANMIKRNVLIANARGELIYLNNQMYKILNIDSESVLNKNMEDTLIPASIKDAYELALKRRSKIENIEIHIDHKVMVEVENEAGEKEEVEENQEIFKGYANVIPIRAKESSLDYYMMVLSEDVFA